MAEYLSTYYDKEGWTAYPEFEFALTKEWEATTFDADDAYVRGYIDNLFVFDYGGTKRVVIDEYKTGQEYDEHAQQKAMYAMVGMVLYPDIDSIEVVGVYLDKKKLKPTTYNRAHLHSMQYTWQRDIAKLDIPIFPARPGIHCRWCPKSNKKGGPCKVG